MNLSFISSPFFLSLPKHKRLCILSEFSHEDNQYVYEESSETMQSLMMILPKCFEESGVTKPEMHLYQNVLLTGIRKELPIDCSRLFSIHHTQNQWNIHFLIRCLRCMEDSIYQEQLSSCIVHLLTEWNSTYRCLCHLLERILRLLPPMNNNTCFLLCQYVQKHSNCLEMKYYYKFLIQLSRSPQGDTSTIMNQLEHTTTITSPYYYIAYFKYHEIDQFTQSLTLLDHVSLDTMLSALAEKDTLFISMLCLISSYSLRKENEVALEFFSLFLKKYEYDVDVVVSMLDESADILVGLMRVCKLIERNPSFMNDVSFKSFWEELEIVLTKMENRRMLEFSVKPILRRIHMIVH